MTVARFTAKKLTPTQVLELERNVVNDFSRMEGLRTILLFGSAVHGEMTNASDIDVVLIFDTKENTSKARKLAPTLRKQATWPMDLLFADSETFQTKSQVGGIYFVARNEGRVIFGEKP